jgi:transposase
MLLADRGYDADWIRELVNQQGAWANIPPKRNRKEPICFSPYLYMPSAVPTVAVAQLKFRERRPRPSRKGGRRGGATAGGGTITFGEKAVAAHKRRAAR